MSNQTNVRNRQAEQSSPVSSVSWLVFKREFADLWVGGRVLILLILFTLVMSVTSVLREVESQLNLIPPAEMIFLTLLGSISFGLFIGLIIGADSISGERERATLETLLLTPTARRQIVVGKFFAALSPWPVTLLLSIPYILVVAQGEDILGQALLLGALLGGALAVAFTGFGMLMSIWSNSNKMSLFVSLFVYLIFLIPTQFPGSAQKGDLGYLIQQLNPMQASSEFLEKVLVNNRTVAEKSPYLAAAILSAVVVTGLLFLYAAPRLHLEGNAPRLARPRWGHATNLLVIAGLVISLALFPAAARAAQPTDPEQALQITIDLPYTTVNAGDEIEFNTVVTNNSTEESPPMNVAMNIVKTGKGDPVDPEDWSPERTQEVEPLAPGESVEQTWTIDAILEGDYMVYMTVIPKPDGPEATSQPVSSPGLHLTVKAFSQTNPGGVLPVAIITPLVLILISLLPRRRRRRGIDTRTPETAE